MKKVEDIDIHEGKYDSEYNSGLESAQSETGSVFYTALVKPKRKPRETV